MSAPSSTGKVTQYTEQYIQNYGFDDLYKVPSVALLGYDPQNLAVRRVTVNENGNLNTDGGSNIQKRLDYGSRTDSQPVYVGYGLKGLASSDATWLVNKFTYDGSDRLTLVQSSVGDWDGRTGLTYS